MIFYFIFFLAVIISHGASDQANPLSDTGQAEKLINSFLICIVQSRDAFPQQELSNRVNTMKKTLISTWNSRKTPKEMAQLTKLSFASALADLTKSGNSPGSVALKKRTIQQCLQKASIEIEGTLNYNFVQEMMQMINVLQEKSKNGNTQPVAASVISREQPRSFDPPSSFQSLTGSILKANNPPPTASSGSLSKNFDYSDGFLPSYESNIPVSSQSVNTFSSPVFSANTAFAEKIPSLSLKVPGIDGLQQVKFQPQAELFSNPFDFSNDFKTSDASSINDYGNKDLTNFGAPFSVSLDSPSNFPSPLSSRLQGNGFSQSRETSFGNTGFSSNLPFSVSTGMNAQVNSFQMPEDVFSINSGFSNNFGLATDFSNNYGIASGFPNNFGLEPDYPNNYGMTPDSSTNFGLTSAFSNNYELASGSSDNFGLASNKQKGGFQTNIDSFNINSGNSNGFQLGPNPFTLSTGTPQDNFSTNWNSNYDVDMTNFEQISPESISSTDNFDSGITANLKGSLNSKLTPSSKDTFPTENWNTNYDEDTSINLEQIPVEDFSSSFGSETKDDIKNDFKESLFLNIISSDNITNFLQKVSKENAGKFANKLENTLQKTFSFNSNILSQNVYQNLFMSSEYPLDEFVIADSLASLISDDLNKQRILSKNQLTKTAEDTKQAIEEAILQTSNQFINEGSSKPEDTSKGELPSNKSTGFKSDSDASVNTNGKIDNQAKSSVNTVKTIKNSDTKTQKHKELYSSTENTTNLKQAEVDKESKNNSNDADINLNIQNEEMDTSGKSEDKKTAKNSTDSIKANNYELNGETDKNSASANQSKQQGVENNLKLDTKTKLSEAKTIGNIQNTNKGDDTEASSVSNNELKLKFANLLKGNILGTGIFEALLDKNLSEKDMEDLSKSYSKLLEEKFRISVDSNKIKLFSEGLSTIKINSDYQNAIQTLANVTTDILIVENKLKQNNLNNVLDLAMQCAFETFSNGISKEEGTNQGTQIATGLDIGTNTSSENSAKSSTGNSKSDLNIKTDKEIKSSTNINNEKPNIVADNSGIDILSSSGEYATDLMKEVKGTKKNMQQTKGNVEANLETKGNVEANLETKVMKKPINVDSTGMKTETSTEKDFKSTFIDLLKSKAAAVGIIKNLEEKQLNPQEVAAMSETYTKVLSEKLQINASDDTAMSFFMDFLNSKSNFIYTIINKTADILSDQEKLLKRNLNSVSDTVIQCLLEAISQSFNLKIDTKAALAANTKIKSTDSDDTKIDYTDFEKSVDELNLKDKNENSKDNTAEKVEPTIMADIENPINSKTDVKQSENFNLDLLADENGETKLGDKTFENKDLSVQATVNGDDLFGQTAAEHTAKIKADGDIMKQTEMNIKPELGKEGTSSDSGVKKNFASLMKAKIIETKKLNVLLKKSLTNEDLVELSKLYTQNLSEKLQTELNNSVVERFISGLLIADKTAEDFATLLTDITADILIDRKILTASSQNMLVDQSVQCMMSTISQLLDENSNSKVDLNTASDTTSTESKKTTVNSNIGSNNAINTNLDFSLSDQNLQAKLAEEFGLGQEFIDELAAKVNMQDKNPKKEETSSDNKDKSNNDNDSNLNFSLPDGNLKAKLAEEFGLGQEFIDQSDAQVNIQDKNPENVETSSDKDKSNNDNKNFTNKPTDKNNVKSEPNSDANNETVSKDYEDKRKDEPLENKNNSQPKLNSVSAEEVKQKLAMDLATALASSEDFRLSVLSGDLENIMQAITAAIEAVCGTETSVAFLKTFNALVK